MLLKFGIGYILLQIILFCNGIECQNNREDPEIYMNVTQLITSKGYPCEEYGVVTPDGFILGVQRIPFGLKSKHEWNEIRPVVFLQHGLLAASSCWVTNLANESLAFVLADSGFDVWLGNFRGNTYSRSHTNLKPSDAKFWDWSWDHISATDIPAMINFALKTSNQSTLHYIGHSEGTLVMFALLSRDPLFADKLNSFFAMGPVTTVGHITGVLRYLSLLTPEIYDLFALFGDYEFLPKSDFIRFIAKTFCTSRVEILCEDLLFLIAGNDASQLNKTRIPVYAAHTPAGTSTRNMVHFAQMVRHGHFQMYDYGSERENLAHYNQKTAPLYHAEKVRAPVYLFSAEKDTLATKQDVAALAKQLPNLRLFDEVPEWNHLDFMWALDAPQAVYEKIIAIMRKL